MAILSQSLKKKCNFRKKTAKYKKLQKNLTFFYNYDIMVIYLRNK